MALENTEKAPFTANNRYAADAAICGRGCEIAVAAAERSSGERAHILNEERKETKTSFAKRFSSLLSLSGPQPIL